MLLKEILQKVGLITYIPENLLDEDLEDVTPQDYVKKNNKYIIRFKDSTFQITLDNDNIDEYLVMTESLDYERETYVSYTIDGVLYRFT